MQQMISAEKNFRCIFLGILRVKYQKLVHWPKCFHIKMRKITLFLIEGEQLKLSYFFVCCEWNDIRCKE